MTLFSRRNILIAGAGGLVAACDTVARDPRGRAALHGAEGVHMRVQRALLGESLAREYRPDQMSPVFRVNGTRRPDTPVYQTLVANNFADWRLTIDGLVARPLRLSLNDIATLPQRAQITRHDCVEGWSAIGKWQGPQLGRVLDLAGLRDTARYIVFHCADRFGSLPYYESIDLVDAYHPQTILAWAMNDKRLSIGHGAPVRLRVERQLGYKHAKYVMRVEAVASLAGIGGGKGGFWEDTNDYEWYAGI